MNYESYSNIRIAKDFQAFVFISEGKRGAILKGAVFTPTEQRGIYNLVFGDLEPGGELDDSSISDNGDRNKILATLVKIIKQYTDKYPGRMVGFQGSTEARTRLYRMAIGLNLEELTKEFEIYAKVHKTGKFVPFKKNMILIGFVIKRKMH